MGDLSRQIGAAAGRTLRGIAPRLVVALLALAAPALAKEPVSLELVLAIDVSTSVNDIEFRHQIEGMALAFRDPEVIGLITGRDKGVAVLVTQWGGFSQSVVDRPWRLLRNERDIELLAQELLGQPRAQPGYLTAICHAITFAAREIESNGYEGYEKKIDVAGDGKNNSGPEPRRAAANALALGITINGLVIGNAEAGLMGYYSRNVMSGPDAFVEYAADFQDFAAAFQRKLKRELVPRMAQAPRAKLAGIAP